MTGRRHAVARGALAHASILREERLTDDSRAVRIRVVEPRLTDNPLPRSPEARLAARAQLERVYHLIRSWEQDDIDEARQLLRELHAAIEAGPASERPLNQRDQDAMLSRIAQAYAGLRLYEPALKIAENLAERARTAGRIPRLIGQLQQQSGRHHALAWEESGSGRIGVARAALEDAARIADQVIEMRPATDGPAAAARLAALATRLRIDLELSALPDAKPDGGRLVDLRARAETLVEQSYALPAVLAMARVRRVALVGMIAAEIARQRPLDEADRASGEAMFARALMQPEMDLYRHDAGGGSPLATRYGDACLISGDPASAGERDKPWEGYAANGCGSAFTWAKSGYQRWKSSASWSLSTRVRI